MVVVLWKAVESLGGRTYREKMGHRGEGLKGCISAPVPGRTLCFRFCQDIKKGLHAPDATTITCHEFCHVLTPMTDCIPQTMSQNKSILRPLLIKYLVMAMVKRSNKNKGTKKGNYCNKHDLVV